MRSQYTQEMMCQPDSLGCCLTAGTASSAGIDVSLQIDTYATNPRYCACLLTEMRRFEVQRGKGIGQAAGNVIAAGRRLKRGSFGC